MLTENGFDVLFDFCLLCFCLIFPLEVNFLLYNHLLFKPYKNAVGCNCFRFNISIPRVHAVTAFISNVLCNWTVDFQTERQNNNKH